MSARTEQADGEARGAAAESLPHPGHRGRRFGGVVANLPTALSDDGRSVDEVRMKDHVQWLLDQGVHGVSCLLNSGGFTYLDERERERVVTCVVDACRGRIPVIAGVTGDTTEASIGFAQAASAAGADAIALQPRSLIALKDAEVVRHYEAVANSATAPIGIYNHPPSTGVKIGPSLYRAIVDASGAVVTKDASGDLASVAPIIRDCGGDMDYLIAEEALVLGGMVMGAVGCCLAMVSVLPAEFVALYEAIERAALEEARTVYYRLLPVFEVFNAIGRPRVVKVVAEMRGHPLGGHRAPVLDVTSEERDRIRRAMELAGVT